MPRLAEDERSRAAAIVDDRQRAEWRAAHIALRLALEHRVGDVVRGRPYRLEAGGKPVLAIGDTLAAAPAFSLSHTDGFALIAVVGTGPVGVDIQVERPIRLHPARIDRLISAGRGLVAELQQPADSPEIAAAIVAWTRLEAFAKARGSGVWAALKDLDIGGRDSVRSQGGTDPDHALPPSMGRDVMMAAAAALAAIHRLEVHDLDLRQQTDRHRAAIAIVSGRPSLSDAERCLESATFAAFLRAFD